METLGADLRLSQFLSDEPDPVQVGDPRLQPAAAEGAAWPLPLGSVVAGRDGPPAGEFLAGDG